jgi:enoyl-CoA hydratase/carnithine racemase
MTSEVNARASSTKVDRPLVKKSIYSANGKSVALLSMNRPDHRNPLDSEMVGALHDRIMESIENDEIFAIIITGEGAAFSAGGDLKGYRDLFDDPTSFRNFLEDFRDVCSLLESCDRPTVAMVNGACVAGGLELALSCDLITMADTAVIGDGHLRFGQLPGAGGSQRLVRAVGAQRAKEWLVTGDLYSADEAAAAGVVTRVISAPLLLQETLALLSTSADHSRTAMAYMKHLVRIAMNTDLADGLDQEIDVVLKYVATSTHAREGLAAFDEKRKPNYLAE